MNMPMQVHLYSFSLKEVDGVLYVAFPVRGDEANEATCYIYPFVTGSRTWLERFEFRSIVRNEHPSKSVITARLPSPQGVADEGEVLEANVQALISVQKLLRGLNCKLWTVSYRYSQQHPSVPKSYYDDLFKLNVTMIAIMKICYHLVFGFEIYV